MTAPTATLTDLDEATKTVHHNPHTGGREWSVVSACGTWRYTSAEATGRWWAVEHLPTGHRSTYWPSLPAARAATADGAARAHLNPAVVHRPAPTAGPEVTQLADGHDGALYAEHRCTDCGRTYLARVDGARPELCRARVAAIRP